VSGRRTFIVDLERVVEVNAPSDQHAATVAQAIDSAVDAAILSVNVGNREIAEKHTQAYRGKSGIRIYDSEDGE
jgi:hypothetical protein